jgi:hypothetical protein
VLRSGSWGVVGGISYPLRAREGGWELLVRDPTGLGPVSWIVEPPRSAGSDGAFSRTGTAGSFRRDVTGWFVRDLAAGELEHRSDRAVVVEAPDLIVGDHVLRREDDQVLFTYDAAGRPVSSPVRRTRSGCARSRLLRREVWRGSAAGSRRSVQIFCRDGTYC